MSIMLDEYKRRVQFKGRNKREYVSNKVSESIDSLINDSQYGFTIEVDGREHDVAILSTKSTQDYERANVIAHNEVGLDRGSLFKWNNEQWIVLQKMFRPEQPGFNGYAYRCTGELKWVDENGVLQIRPGYINSGRTTNSLTYTPDVNNKFDNIILHDTDWSMIAAIQQDITLHNEMRFIIKGKAYRVTNIDNVSIDHVSILSMVDDKLLDSDDRINGVASNGEYSIRLDVQTPVNLYAGDIKDIPISVIKDGIPVSEEIVLQSSDPNIVEVQGNQIIGRGIGKTYIKCFMAKNKYVYKDNIEIMVEQEHRVDTKTYAIEGPNHIDWNSSATYIVPGVESVSISAEYLTKVKHTEEKLPNGLRIAIKDKYAGSILLSCEVEGQIITKEILIKTL